MRILLTSATLRAWIRRFVPGGMSALIAYFLAKLMPHAGTAWIRSFASGGWYAALQALVLGLYAGVFLWLERKFKWASAFFGARPLHVNAVPALSLGAARPHWWRRRRCDGPAPDNAPGETETPPPQGQSTSDDTQAAGTDVDGAAGESSPSGEPPS